MSTLLWGYSKATLNVEIAIIISYLKGKGNNPSLWQKFFNIGILLHSCSASAHKMYTDKNNTDLVILMNNFKSGLNNPLRKVSFISLLSSEWF